MRAYQGVAAGFTLLGLLVMSATSAPPAAPIALRGSKRALSLFACSWVKGTRALEVGTAKRRSIGERCCGSKGIDSARRSREWAGFMERQESCHSQNGRQSEGRPQKRSRRAEHLRRDDDSERHRRDTESSHDATLSVETEHGNFAVKLADLAAGAPKAYLDGQAIAQRVPRTKAVADGPKQQDFPAAVADGQGGLWITYVEHSPRGTELSEALTKAPQDFTAYKPQDGGDQVKLTHVDATGTVLEALDVTTPGRDVWRPASRVALRIKSWWSGPRIAREFRPLFRSYTPPKQEFSTERQLTTNPGADTDVSLAASHTGNVWMAWQSWENGRAFVRVGTAQGEFQRAEFADSARGNAWSPSLAIDREGNIAVAYDTYEAGNYDVRLSRFDNQGKHKTTLIVANSPRFEARPTVAFDPKGAPGSLTRNGPRTGAKTPRISSKARERPCTAAPMVKVKCVDGERILEVADPLLGTTGRVEAVQQLSAHRL